MARAHDDVIFNKNGCHHALLIHENDVSIYLGKQRGLRGFQTILNPFLQLLYEHSSHERLRSEKLTACCFRTMNICTKHVLLVGGLSSCLFV